MANKPISDNTAFPFETNVRAIAGLAGFKTGTTNSNTKIGGTELVQSVINGGTANAGGLAVYSTSGTGKELSTYILDEKSEVLLKGVAVGSKISSGKIIRELFPITKNISGIIQGK